jgi:hypothetical protein
MPWSVRDNMQAGVSDGVVTAGFVMAATAVCTMMATVAGWALVLVIVDGASTLPPRCASGPPGPLVIPDRLTPSR